MYNKFQVKPLYEVTKTLARVAQGVTPADLVITNARLVNVCTAEIVEQTDVAVSCGRIALVGDALHCIGEETQVIDAQGSYIAPGFLDGHIHVESSMLSVSEYAKAVVKHGTVGIYMDPHEICNVLGLDGVAYMMEDAKGTPLKTMVTTPSCVPAVPGFEDTGAAIGPEDIKKTMQWESVVGLGEMMNFPGVLMSADHPHDEIAETLKAGKVVTGHYSMPETAKGLNAYIASGIRCCHESTRAEDALAKMRLGMYAMIREGSAWRDLTEVIKAVTENQIDSRFAVLVSDDTHPHTLLADGHMDHIVRRAIEEGIDPIKAIQMVTINCAECFRMGHEMGSITPGKTADIVFMKHLDKVDVDRVIIDGNVVYENGIITTEISPYRFPEAAMHSMHIKDTITPDSFKIKANSEADIIRSIEIRPARVGTFETHVTLQARKGYLESDVSQDILKAAVFERHHKTGKAGYGFIKGFGIKNGAMASTVAHDAHNLLVVGTNDADMALAANTLIQCEGGMTVVSEGKVLGVVPLPIAGLMNNKSLEEMAALVANLDTAWKETGCGMESPFMTMALIPLACLPELRLTNRGLVDCNKFEFVSLFV